MSTGRGTGSPSPAALEKAVHTAMSRMGWEVLDLDRQSVQRRGRDRSIIYRAKVRRDGDERRATLVAHLSDRRPPGARRPMLVEGRQVHVWRYPSDPFLPGLPNVTSNRRVRELLDSFGVGEGAPRLRRRVYRATRRAVVQADLLDGDGEVVDTVYLKVLGDRSAKKIAAKTQQLVDHHLALGEVVPVPEIVGTVIPDGILATANVPGETLRQAILDQRPAPFPADVAGLALAIAPLRIDSTASPTRYADPTRHAATLAEIVPDQAARVRHLVAHAKVDGPLVTVHGDFHDGQVLVQDGNISGLLDIDGVGRGHLASDAGRIIAYIDSIRDISRADEATVDAYVHGLRDAFADHVDPEMLGRAVGAAWIALATGPHRRQQNNWEALTRRRIEHAHRWLEDTGVL